MGAPLVQLESHKTKARSLYRDGRERRERYSAESSEVRRGVCVDPKMGEMMKDPTCYVQARKLLSTARHRHSEAPQLGPNHFSGSVLRVRL